MRFTIERIRTLVLAAGVLLIVVLAAFLAVGKWKNPFNRRDIPKRLGIDIQQEANGVTYTQAHGGHTIFKIHASKVIQLRNDHATLHDVQIELYGQNGNSVDRIQGSEFDYDQKTGMATAAGAVEITLMRPAAPPPTGPGAQAKSKAKGASGEIHVKTSGLVFDQQTGIASTDQRVDFSTQQGNGSAIGASYDSDRGLLILDRSVELITRRGPSPVVVHADHAEFDRNAEVGHLRGASAETRGENAHAALAQVVFRDDGSVERLDGSDGVTLSTASSRLDAPRGSMIFNPSNEPRSGRFEGGVTLQSQGQGRQMSGNAALMTLAFNSAGELRHVHLQGGVELHTQQLSHAVANGQTVPVQMRRTWQSPVADVDFRQAGAGRIEPAQVHGTGGVVLSGETRRGAEPAVPSRLAADEVTGEFGPNSTLTMLTGIGHANLEETAANGAEQTATGERLQARFAQAASLPGAAAQGGQIESAQLDGNVILVQTPAPEKGTKPAPALRATAGRAVYQAAGQLLHLSIHPRIENGGMELTADRVDVSQASGQAFAHGDVKATWLNAEASGENGAANADLLGGKGPAHAVAADAELQQATGKATFLGKARLWQQDNSISAPMIVIFRQSQTLVARTTNPAEPVIAVMLSAAEPVNHPRNDTARTGAPSVVRVRGGDLWYSDAERKAVIRAYPLPAVIAQSQDVESSSAQVELYLAQPGALKQAGTTPAAVERMNALGHVVLTSQDRRGTGEKLTYTAGTAQYVLTGTASAPPRLSDPQRGSVTGAALIFNSRDDSVSIEGGGHQTVTETTAPR